MTNKINDEHNYVYSKDDHNYIYSKYIDDSIKDRMKVINLSISNNSFQFLKESFLENSFNIIFNSNQLRTKYYIGEELNIDDRYGTVVVDKTFAIPIIIDDLYICIASVIYSKISLYIPNRMTGNREWNHFWIPVRKNGEFINDTVRRFLVSEAYFNFKEG